jgi:hypothetical protein
MNTIITATGLPGGLSSAAALNASFGSVLSIPANLVNKPFQVRVGGVIFLPGGRYGGGVSVILAGQSNNGNILGSGTSIFVAGPPQKLPFQIAASLYCDPFRGVILDVNAGISIFSQPGVSFTSSQSGVVVGDNSSFSSNGGGIASSFGGGTLSFSSPVPLVVLANLFNSGSNSGNPSTSDGSPVLPTITAQLSTFELEYN